MLDNSKIELGQCCWNEPKKCLHMQLKYLHHNSGPYIQHTIWCTLMWLLPWCIQTRTNSEVEKKNKRSVQHAVDIAMKTSVRKMLSNCSIHLSSNPFHYVHTQAKRKVIWRMCEKAFIYWWFFNGIYTFNPVHAMTFSMQQSIPIKGLAVPVFFLLYFTFFVTIHSFFFLPLSTENIII